MAPPDVQASVSLLATAAPRLANAVQGEDIVGPEGQAMFTEGEWGDLTLARARVLDAASDVCGLELARSLFELGVTGKRIEDFEPLAGPG